MKRFAFVAAMAGSALGYRFAMWGVSLESLVHGLGMGMLMALIGIVLVVAYDAATWALPL